MSLRLPALLAAVCCAGALMLPVSAQTSRPQATSARFRTSWGHPDLQGRWTNATLTPLERPAELGSREYFTESEAIEYASTALKRFLAQTNLAEEAEISGEFEGLWGEERSIVPTRRTSLITGPTGRVPPLTPDGRARAAARAALRKADKADHPEERSLSERCLWFPVEGPPMLPSIVYNSNYQIVQTPGFVTILIEQGYGTRIIPLDARPHPPAHVTSWFGDSRGRWDGDTLVVETTNFNDKRDLRGSTPGLRLTERFRRASADMILYEFTADDPATWTTPWTAEVPMTRLDGLLYEYACHEGNRSLEYVLRGARAAEQRTP